MLPFSIDLRPGEPVPEQILAAVREAIASGQLRDGDAFPSARALAQELRISPSAAGKVVAELRGDGSLAEQKGSGLMVRIALHNHSGISAGRDEMATVVVRSSGMTQAARSHDYPFLASVPESDQNEGKPILGKIGGYEVLKQIGRGGMGVVFEAWDPALMRNVAVKLLAPHLASSPEARARFVREARAAASIDHENVLPIHAVGEMRGFPYLVMPLVNGGSLQKILDRNGALEVAEIYRIGAKVASGLAAAHMRGLMHRDIKPDNILLESGGGRVWIADFGLARAAEDIGLTVSGMFAATPSYVSPEQVEADEVDFRTDLFSLGSLLYAMATGSPPFTGGSTLAILRKVADETPSDPRGTRPDFPPKLADLIFQLLEKRPYDRPSGAAEVAERLAIQV